MSNTINVWLVEANTVYKDVPYTVVADWIQQSRVLEDDRVLFKGTKEWVRVGDSPEFSAYLPRAQEFSAEDEAEALEPVELDLHWKRSAREEDDEVDMVPLIDVSLVLLIFFILMGTSSSGMFKGSIATPGAENGTVNQNRELVWIGVDLDGDGGLVYSIGRASKPPLKDKMTFDEVIKELDGQLPTDGSRREVSIRAHEKVPHGEIRRLTVELTSRRSRVSRQFVEVTEKR